ncbi:hypothetical protein H9Q13_06120 [Pontibacter sp. JH31]|uniref:PH domain-containing protein n=1 Tax=Pontibacter aquaedesilientis TaxID=2766980 RepID=A0ABR7XEL8_9BACT|nr:hypothetical protein [Pontibacter aquaedesilientis]MBD1396737.1 hypothetical protein [Pontibacter aquaedesilientis]
MYVNLYPNQALKRTKRVLLWGGAFMLLGGVVALLSEMVWQEQPRWAWVMATCLLIASAAWAMAVGAGKLHLKDAYFSMTPERISYRLNLYSPERVIYWSSIDSIQASIHTLVFELKDSKQVVMRLGNIQCNQTANHVSVSIQLAAVQQQVEVNQVKPKAQQVN